MQNKKRNTPYKLSVRSTEVHRLNTIEDVVPSELKYRQPSESFISARVEKLSKL